jgi:uncharacterized protein
MAADAERLREAQVIAGAQGRPRAVYDVERTFIHPVPESFRRTIPFPRGARSTRLAPPDTAALAEWYREGDLLTLEYPPPLAKPTTQLPLLTDLSLDLAGSCNLNCVYCFEKDIASRLGPMSPETARASVDFLFAQAGDGNRVALHFGSGEPMLNFDLLQEVVSYAQAQAVALGKRVDFHLTTNGTLLTEEKANFIAAHPFFVRMSMDGPYHDQTRSRASGRNSYAAAERGFLTLRDYLGNRLTVNVVHCRGMRVKDIYLWAISLGIVNLEVIKVGTFQGGPVDLTDGHLLDFREDLAWLLADLRQRAEGSQPILHYLPITKVLRRLIGPAPTQRFCGVASTYLGVSSKGGLYPCFRHLGLKEYYLGSVVAGVDDVKRLSFLSVEAQPVDSRPICFTCWARKLCGGGCYADSVVYGPDKQAPQVQHCPYWKAEIEAAILLHHELAKVNPGLLFTLIGRAVPQVE